ncbi:hypothetical protein Pcinc_015446 [Petrolisthes cinctipes]|uniref:PiggyBac transposable element-derived protein domain-containing protein n=1 Tax=Petrolisthes cinctipes TaxID=88211 RepID=A0AAE1KPR7_PETCI|nr:hypothetical protein Pcinc_015446 [Petrolisthes cinctipes]
MKPSAFYGKRYDAGVPEESEDEKLESEDDDYDPEKDLEISDEESEDDGDESEDDQEESEHEVVPSTSGKGKRAVRRTIWKNKRPENVKSLEKVFLGQVHTSDGSVKSPIEYFDELFDSNMKECMPSDTQMKKSGRGTSVIQVAEMDDVDLRVVKWHDNRGVILLSNFAALEPQNTVKRYFNLTDAPRKAKLPLLMFKLEVANCLLQKGKSVGTKRGRPSVDVEELYKEKAKKG